MCECVGVGVGVGVEEGGWEVVTGGVEEGGRLEEGVEAAAECSGTP